MSEAPRRLRWISTLVPTRSADRILEVGCGNGQLLALLAARVPRATLIGIDRSALQARTATQRLAELPAPPRVHHLALENAPTYFADDRFTRIIAMNVNLAWTNPAAAGEALGALLAPRGSVLLGFEPPSPSGRAGLQAKLKRAAPEAGFTQHAVHVDTESSAFAVEWRARPRARTGTA